MASTQFVHVGFPIIVHKNPMGRAWLSVVGIWREKVRRSVNSLLGTLFFEFYHGHLLQVIQVFIFSSEFVSVLTLLAKASQFSP